MPRRYVVAESSVTVTSTPVAVANVKLDADLESMIPVAPPSAGGAAGPPPTGVDAAGTDCSAAEAVPAPASPTIATVSPAAVIHAPRFPHRDRRVRGPRSRSATVVGAAPAGEWLAGS
jgi:hypothetical protein